MEKRLLNENLISGVTDGDPKDCKSCEGNGFRITAGEQRAVAVEPCYTCSGTGTI